MLLIPSQAIQVISGKYFVRVIQAGKIEIRRIDVRQVFSNKQVEVIRGLREGDAIVIPMQN